MEGVQTTTQMQLLTSTTLLVKTTNKISTVSQPRLEAKHVTLPLLLEKISIQHTSVTDSPSKQTHAYGPADITVINRMHELENK